MRKHQGSQKYLDTKKGKDFKKKGQIAKEADVAKLVQNAEKVKQVQQPKPPPVKSPVEKPVYALEKPFTREDTVPIASPTVAGKVIISFPTQETRKPFKPQKTFPFLYLPQELQDQIYGYVFDQPMTFHVKWVSGNGFGRKALTYCLPNQSPAAQPKVDEPAWQRRRRLDLPRRFKSTETNIPAYTPPTGPLSLLHVHPQIAVGAAKFFYRLHTFRFNGMRAIGTFLDMVSQSSKEEIRHLEIVYARYGQPELTVDSNWKLASDTYYEMTMYRIGCEMKGLQTFKMDYNVNDIPLDFGPDAEWRLPFEALEGKGLRQVQIHVHTRLAAHADAMEVESYLIQQNLLDEQYRDTCDAVERRSNTEKPMRLLPEYKQPPIKILTITIPGYPRRKPREITTPLMAVPVKCGA